MTEQAVAGPLEPLVAFGRELRARGLPVGTGRILTFVRAVAALGLTDRLSLYWAGRVSMIGRKEDLVAYDLAFEDWYRALRSTEDLKIELDLPTLARQGVDWGDRPEDRSDRCRMARTDRGGRGARVRRRGRDPDRRECR
jgi:uncharacterized protein with von Willebrand factor type A (vWA) domain